MEIFNSRRITAIGVIAALYFVLTVAISPLSFGSIQFRFSEALMLLCFFNKDYIISLTLGCFIANLFSTVGPIDTVVGTSATLISAILIYLCRKDNSLSRMIICSLFPVVFNGIFVAAELKYVADLPFWLTAGQVAFGELVCVSVIGVILFNVLSKNRHFVKLISCAEKPKHIAE